MLSARNVVGQLLCAPKSMVLSHIYTYTLLFSTYHIHSLCVAICHKVIFVPMDRLQQGSFWVWAQPMRHDATLYASISMFDMLQNMQCFQFYHCTKESSWAILRHSCIWTKEHQTKKMYFYANAELFKLNTEDTTHSESSIYMGMQFMKQ